MSTGVPSGDQVSATSSTAFHIEEIAGRVLMLLWLYFVVRGLVLHVLDLVANGASETVLWLEFTQALLLLAFSCLAVGLTVLRRPARAVAQGLEPRITAVLGSYLMVSIPLLPGIEIGPFWSVVAIVVMVAGLASSTWCLYWLGRSYSIMATARRLVTGGPYRIVRHPLYACETLTLIGVVIANFSIWSVLVGAATVAFLYRRMLNEERVLAAAFPEYAAYARQVPPIVPRLVARNRAPGLVGQLTPP